MNPMSADTDMRDIMAKRATGMRPTLKVSVIGSMLFGYGK